MREAQARRSCSAKTPEAARLSAALLDQFGTTVKPGKLEILDIECEPGST